MSTEVFGFWASIVCLRLIAETVSADGRAFSQRSSGANRRATLTGSSPVCTVYPQTKALIGGFSDF